MRINEIIGEWMIMPQTIKPMGLIQKKGYFDFKNKGNNRANEAPIEQESVPRLLGKAEASLMHGLEMAQNVIKKDYGIAEVQAKVIAQNWPPLLDKIHNVYKTEDAMGVGTITKQNTTKDVKPGETQRQAKKLHLR
jgi:hypothetical protein